MIRAMMTDLCNTQPSYASAEYSEFDKYIFSRHHSSLILPAVGDPCSLPARHHARDLIR